jgi:hypothetical protein
MEYTKEQFEEAKKIIIAYGPKAHFGNDSKLFKEHHRKDSERIQKILLNKGFENVGIGEAEGLWMEHSDSFAAGWIGMDEEDSDESLYEKIKYYIVLHIPLY